LEIEKMKLEGTVGVVLPRVFRWLPGSVGRVACRALAMVLAAAARWGEDAQLCRDAGETLADAGFEERSLECYSRAVSLQPGDATSWYRRGVLLYGLGRYEEAERSFQEAVKGGGSEEWTPTVLYLRAQSLIELSRDEEAMTCLESALQMNPEFADAWESKGVCLHYAGMYEEAVTCYDRAVWASADMSSAWLNRGYALARLERHDEALHSYNEALKHDPECADCWIGKGHVLEIVGRLEEAIKHYDQALGIDPECVDALVDKADCLRELGRDDEAQRCLDEVVALEVRDVDILLHGLTGG
jgi:tetratricopeptide (TPR) repeat protein